MYPASITDVEEILKGNPMDIVQQLMGTGWVSSDQTIQQFMDGVASRSDGTIRSTSPAEFVEDLVRMKYLSRLADGKYVLNL
jgi:hypothetical protein